VAPLAPGMCRRERSTGGGNFASDAYPTNRGNERTYPLVCITLYDLLPTEKLGIAGGHEREVVETHRLPVEVCRVSSVERWAVEREQQQLVPMTDDTRVCAMPRSFVDLHCAGRRSYIFAVLRANEDEARGWRGR
jgi:hypothetical protein